MRNRPKCNCYIEHGPYFSHVILGFHRLFQFFYLNLGQFFCHYQDSGGWHVPRDHFRKTRTTNKQTAAVCYLYHHSTDNKSVVPIIEESGSDRDQEEAVIIPPCRQWTRSRAQVDLDHVSSAHWGSVPWHAVKNDSSLFTDLHPLAWSHLWFSLSIFLSSQTVCHKDE